MQVASEARTQSFGGPLKTKPVTPYLGVEVFGLNLNDPLDPAVEKQLRDLWVEYGMILVRGSNSTVEGQMRLSRLFGELQPSAHGAKRGLNAGDNPYLLDLYYNPDAKSVFSENVMKVDGVERVGFLGWHWDQAFMPKMVRGGVLRAVQPAAVSGRTGFTDGIAAYNRLPDSLKARIEGLEVVYKYTTKMEENKFGFPEVTVAHREPDQQHPNFEPTLHPMVITQKETGRKVLHLSPMHSQYILGMDRSESDALLSEIANVVADERYAYRHQWKVNDMIAWDNWRILHAADGVPPGCPRRMQRTTIAGDYGYGGYLDPNHNRDDSVYSIDD